MIREINIKQFKISKTETIKDALRNIEANKEGIVLVVDAVGRLVGTITDGDIRRYILHDGDIHTKCGAVMNKKFISVNTDDMSIVQELMMVHRIRHIPVVAKNKKLLKLYVSDKIYEHEKGVCAVIMAGGEGKRLEGLTKETPKPMIPVNGKPILEEIILCLKRHNILDISIALNYKASAIKRYFGTGKKLGVSIHYIEEKKKLGTAGALSLLPRNQAMNTYVVLNADILTSINFKRFLEFYREHSFDMCVAAKEYIIDIPYGIFEARNEILVDIKEKPQQKVFCNAGMYILNNNVLKLIPKNKRCDMTDVIKIAKKKKLPVGMFPIFEYWLDIGNVRDYETAQKEYETHFRRKIYE